MAGTGSNGLTAGGGDLTRGEHDFVFKLLRGTTILISYSRKKKQCQHCDTTLYRYCSIVHARRPLRKLIVVSTRPWNDARFRTAALKSYTALHTSCTRMHLLARTTYKQPSQQKQKMAFGMMLGRHLLLAAAMLSCIVSLAAGKKIVPCKVTCTLIVCRSACGRSR